MPRYNIQVFTANPDGTYVDGAVVTVTGRNPATPVAVYALSSSVTAMATPILTVGGTTNFWVDDLIAYNLTITGTGFGSYTTYIEAITAESINRGFILAGQGGGGGGSASGTNFWATPTGVSTTVWNVKSTDVAVQGKLGVGTATPATALEVRSGIGTFWLGTTNNLQRVQAIADPATPTDATSKIYVDRANALDAHLATNQTFTGLNVFSTPIAVTGSVAFPAITTVGSISATPGIRYPDGTYDVTASEVFRTTHTFAVAGTISTPSGESNFIPPFFISLGSRQTANIVKARYAVHKGTTPAIVQLQKNDQAILGYVTLPVTATPTETLSTVSVAENDRINLYVTSAVQTAPTNLTVTVVLEHTVL